MKGPPKIFLCGLLVQVLYMLESGCSSVTDQQWSSVTAVKQQTTQHNSCEPTAHLFTSSLTHSPTHSLTHSLIHTLTHSLTHSFTHTHCLTHSHTHSFTHTLSDTHTHSFTHSHTHSDTLTHSLTRQTCHTATITTPCLKYSVACLTFCYFKKPQPKIILLAHSILIIMASKAFIILY